MADFKLGNASGNPWSSVSPNKTADSITGWETQFNNSVISNIETADFRSGLYPWVNVLDSDYGADSTGATDSTAAFQAAVDSVSANEYGVVLIPAGTYRLDSAVTVTSKFVSFQGMGSGVTTIKVAGSGISWDLSGASVQNQYHPVYVKGMTFASTEEASSGTPSGVCLAYAGEQNKSGIGEYSFVVEDVNFRGDVQASNCFRKCITIDYCQRSYFHRVGAYGLNGAHASSNDPVAKMESFLEVGSDSTSVRLNGVEVFQADKVVNVPTTSTVTEGVLIHGCVLVKVNYGLYMPGNATNVTYSVVSDSHISSYLGAVHVGSNNRNDSHFIHDNFIFIRSDSLAGDDYVGVYMKAALSMIHNNVFLNQKTTPGTLGSEKAIVVADPATAARDGNIIHDNVIQNFNDATIELESGASGNVVYGNLLIGDSTAVPPTDASTFDVSNHNVIQSVPIGAPPAIASAATMALDPPGLPAYRVSGVANITNIPPTYGGHVINLYFSSNAKVFEAGNIELEGAGLWTATADDILTLVCVPTGSGTDWFEVSRSVN